MKHLLTILALAATTGAYAQSISSDDARQRAAQFFTAKSAAAGPHRTPAKIDPVLAYTAQTTGTPSFYVFNRAVDADGFVIINALDTTDQPILGYSDSSSFDPDNLPDNFRWWLQQYEVNGVCKAPARAARHNIDPIVKTKWGQNTPFNNTVTSETGYNLVTGCTATAMAQLMKHHEFPTRGKGTKTYVSNCTVNKNHIDLPISVDFSQTLYDWNNMLDVYGNDYSQDQGNAVAWLMYHAGVAEGTNYGDTESSADDRHSATAMIEHFDYDPGMLRAERIFVSDEEWNEILYTELASGRPIMYSGTTYYNEGHCFICDGYKDGLYHFNWGWNGTSDGYYAITGYNALRPGSQGTGGAASGQGFVYAQSINYNIKPRTQDDPAVLLAHFASYDRGGHAISYQPYRIKTASSSSLSYAVSVDCAAGDENISIYCVPYNYGVQTTTAILGVQLVSSSTGEEYVFEGGNITLPPGGYPENYSVITFNTKNLTHDGEYKVYPVYRDYYNSSIPWKKLSSIDGMPEVTLTISNTDTRPTYVPELLTVTKVTPLGNPYVFSTPDDFKLKITVNNNSGKSLTQSFVCPRITCDGGSAYSKGRGWNNIPVGFTGDLEIDMYDSAYSFTPGKVYTIEFYKSTSFNDPTNEPLPGVSSFSFLYASPEPTAKEVTSAVRELKGGRGSIKMIEALVNKILGK